MIDYISRKILGYSVESQDTNRFFTEESMALSYCSSLMSQGKRVRLIPVSRIQFDKAICNELLCFHYRNIFTESSFLIAYDSQTGFVKLGKRHFLELSIYESLASGEIRLTGKVTHEVKSCKIGKSIIHQGLLMPLRHFSREWHKIID
jgi:hypothetical protein